MAISKPHQLRLPMGLVKYLTVIGLLFVPALPIVAQNNLVLFGDRDTVLGYHSRSARPRTALNFYRFFVPLPRNRAVAELQIIFPQGMASIFNPERLEVRDRRTGKIHKITEQIINEEAGSVRLVFGEPISAQGGQELEIISEGATNPSSGMYRVRVSVLGTEKNPLFISLGHWLVSIY